MHSKFTDFYNQIREKYSNHQIKFAPKQIYSISKYFFTKQVNLNLHAIIMFFSSKAYSIQIFYHIYSKSQDSIPQTDKDNCVVF